MHMSLIQVVVLFFCLQNTMLFRSLILLIPIKLLTINLQVLWNFVQCVPFKCMNVHVHVSGFPKDIGFVNVVPLSLLLMTTWSMNMVTGVLNANMDSLTTFVLPLFKHCTLITILN